MKFEPLPGEKVIYEEDDWKLTVESDISILFIYKANYNKNMYTCRAYKPFASNRICGEINIRDLPSNMQKHLLKEII